jgi:hypothetical protein
VDPPGTAALDAPGVSSSLIETSQRQHPTAARRASSRHSTRAPGKVGIACSELRSSRSTRSPTDAGRGHPWPDMIQLAARTLEVADPTAVAVACDTPSDVQAGGAAGASIVADVLTGAGTRAQTEVSGSHVSAGRHAGPTAPRLPRRPPRLPARSPRQEAGHAGAPPEPGLVGDPGPGPISTYPAHVRR